ncbi:glycoside hydrolase family 88 protein [Saccharibacillus sp. CPCC 101409]|uniref:beta-galactosidase BglB n=1 Tax=Saccharibacillus sp. CPCC 101409 TaxID=3058041 RepID=UPI002671E5CC|nr:glycoside hydrolase family 88 protein [Saccharibacillus sp. CPCC 101409]MDO3412552.1 glycoside hydrolase family 88 protein [Saccharibacillus sp. CPCC 101409]
MSALTKEKLEQTIFDVIERMKGMRGSIEETAPIGIISMENWEWPQGVGLFALYGYYRETGDGAVLRFLTDWFDARIAEGLPSKNVNTMCPMLTLTYLAEETGRPDYLDLCREWLDYVLNDMPRTEECGIQHEVTGSANEGQLWDDTLYMTVLFVARMGVLLRDDAYIQESMRQFLVHLKYLTDPATGLFFHGWTFQEGGHHFAKALWARGNSWYTAGLVDYLDMTEQPDGVRSFLLSSLRRQADKLLDLQSPEGAWHTLLDDSDSYLETSATAAFAYGMLKAYRRGHLDGKHRDGALRALDYVLSQIGEDGVVRGVSYGTGMGRSLQDYREVPVCPMPYGQSMALLLLVEALKHGGEAPDAADGEGARGGETGGAAYA